MQEFYSHTGRFEQWLFDQWGLEVKHVRQDIGIEGSPERTVSRVVIEDQNDNLFLLEKFSRQKFQLRHQVAQVVEYINKKGLVQTLPYRRTRTGKLLPEFGQGYFQISRFVYSTPLKRPQYLLSETLGNEFSQFLIDMVSAASGIATQVCLPNFSIKTYVYQILDTMRKHDPQWYPRFLPVLTFLEEKFMDVHDQIPVLFCHGDLHPLNVIWKQDQIKAVIDWEFTGIKADVYDAANLVGCAGIENPESLGQPMVMSFLKKMKTESRISDIGWRYFLEYLIALRFAWLSEWLRKKDVQMIETEAAYMMILVKNYGIIKKGWGIGG